METIGTAWGSKGRRIIIYGQKGKESKAKDARFRI